MSWKMNEIIVTNRFEATDRSLLLLLSIADPRIAVNVVAVVVVVSLLFLSGTMIFAVDSVFVIVIVVALLSAEWINAD